MTDHPIHQPLGRDWLEHATAECAAGRFVPALDTARHALDSPLSADMRVRALDLAALCALGLGEFAHAEQYWRDALALQPDFSDAYSNLGALLMSLARYDDARELHERWLDVAGSQADALLGLARALRALRRLPEAEARLREALAARPGNAEIHNNLGSVLHDLDRRNEAAIVFYDALKMRPRCATAAYNLGSVLKQLGRFEAAETAYRLVLNIDPAHSEANFALAVMLLSLGRFDEGWSLYALRYTHPRYVRAATQMLVNCPRWRGEPLEGKRLLLWQEDGLGDMIQFGRYFKMLKARGLARVEFACTPALQPLFARVASVDTVIDHQSGLDRAHEFDFCVSPMSLPQYLGATLDDAAPADYLGREDRLVDPARTATWQARLALIEPGTTIGLVWKGNPRHHNDAHRSMPSLATLAPLWSVPDIRFVSLQKGAGEDEAQSARAQFDHLASGASLHSTDSYVNAVDARTDEDSHPDDSDQAVPLALAIEPIGSEVDDLADTAAIIAELDLVISVDSSVAHLAASLGKPCWILLPERGVDWRWMHGRDDSPWYPNTVRLFRREIGEPWAKVVERVRVALSAFDAQ